MIFSKTDKKLMTKLFVNFGKIKYPFYQQDFDEFKKIYE